MKKTFYMIYLGLCLVALVVTILDIYSFRTWAFVLSGIIMLVKVMTSIALPSQLSNSYAQEQLTKDLNAHPVMSYQTLVFLLSPLLIIIFVGSLIA